jgi:type IV pilus assembly protein PilW
MKRSRRNRGFQLGFSLVELMVAMTIGLIIMGTAITLFVNSKKQYQATDSAARLQENARLVMFYLSQDLRREGFFGCVSDDLKKITSQLFDGATFKRHSVAIGATPPGTQLVTKDTVATSAILPLSATDAETCTGTCPQSDSLNLVYLDLSQVRKLTGKMANTSDTLTVDPAFPFPFLKEDIVAVTDCLTMDVFQITAITPDNKQVSHDARATGGGRLGNSTNTPPTNSLSKAYGKPTANPDPEDRDAWLLKLNQAEYYLKPDTNGVRTLFRGDQAVLQGVDALQLTYGVATTAATNPTYTDLVPNTFVNAGAVTDWDRVVAVRVGFLASTEADTATGEIGTDVDTRTYTVNGQTVGPFNDRKLRKVFESTIQLKNVRLAK